MSSSTSLVSCSVRTRSIILVPMSIVSVAPIVKQRNICFQKDSYFDDDVSGFAGISLSLQILNLSSILEETLPLTDRNNGKKA